MLPGVARKLAIPFVLVCIAGWITFAVGFGLRNFHYKDRDNAPEHAAYPDFLMLWLFAVSCPVLLILSFINIFWDHSISRLLVNIILPFFLVGAGGTLMFDAFYIYSYYQSRDGNMPYIKCGENGDILGRFDIHGDQNFVPVEFAGAVTTVLFYWVYLLLAPFFASSKSYRNY